MANRLTINAPGFNAIPHGAATPTDPYIRPADPQYQDPRDSGGVKIAQALAPVREYVQDIEVKNEERAKKQGYVQALQLMQDRAGMDRKEWDKIVERYPQIEGADRWTGEFLLRLDGEANVQDYAIDLADQLEGAASITDANGRLVPRADLPTLMDRTWAKYGGSYSVRTPAGELAALAAKDNVDRVFKDEFAKELRKNRLEEVTRRVENNLGAAVAQFGGDPTSGNFAIASFGKEVEIADSYGVKDLPVKSFRALRNAVLVMEDPGVASRTLEFFAANKIAGLDHSFNEESSVQGSLAELRAHLQNKSLEKINKDAAEATARHKRAMAQVESTYGPAFVDARVKGIPIAQVVIQATKDINDPKQFDPEFVEDASAWLQTQETRYRETDKGRSNALANEALGVLRSKGTTAAKTFLDAHTEIDGDDAARIDVAIKTLAVNEPLLKRYGIQPDKETGEWGSSAVDAAIDSEITGDDDGARHLKGLLAPERRNASFLVAGDALDLAEQAAAQPPTAGSTPEASVRAAIQKSLGDTSKSVIAPLRQKAAELRTAFFSTKTKADTLVARGKAHTGDSVALLTEDERQLLGPKKIGELETESSLKNPAGEAEVDFVKSRIATLGGEAFTGVEGLAPKGILNGFVLAPQMVDRIYTKFVAGYNGAGLDNEPSRWKKAQALIDALIEAEKKAQGKAKPK